MKEQRKLKYKIVLFLLLRIQTLSSVWGVRARHMNKRKCVTQEL